MVAAHLPPLPTTTDAKTGQSYYAVYEGLNHSWWTDTSNRGKKLTSDPRSLIMLQGILPDLPPLIISSSDNTTTNSPVPQHGGRVIVDSETARATSDKVWEIWGDENIRGWGRPVLAMNAARIGRPDRAIYHLTAFDYWDFDDAGKYIKGNPPKRPRFCFLIVDFLKTGFAVRGGDGGTPPPFLPGNAGLLLAGKSIKRYRGRPFSWV